MNQLLCNYPKQTPNNAPSPTTIILSYITFTIYIMQCDLNNIIGTFKPFVILFGVNSIMEAFFAGKKHIILFVITFQHTGHDC